MKKTILMVSILLMSCNLLMSCQQKKDKVVSNQADLSKKAVTSSQDPVAPSPTEQEPSGDRLRKYGNSVGNLVNGGFIAANEDYLFYSNPSDKGKLYKIGQNGSEKTKLSDDACSYLNVIDSWVYYVNNSGSITPSEAPRSIFKIKTDGTQKTKLNNDSSIFVNTIDNWVYYMKSESSATGEQGIYKMKSDGSEPLMVSNLIGDALNVTNQWYIWVGFDYSLLYTPCVLKMRRDGSQKEPTKIIENENILPYFLSVQENWMYYSNNKENYKLYKANLDGGEITLLSKDCCLNINVYGQWIYYVNKSDGNTIYRVNIDGTQRKKLSNERCEEISILGEYIYFSSPVNQGFKYRLNRMKQDGSSKIIIANE